MLKIEAKVKIIKDTFKDNDALLLAMRNVMLNLDPTEDEKALVKSQIKGDVKKVVFDYLLPQLTRDSDITNPADKWLGIEQAVFKASKEQITQVINYKARQIYLMEQALLALEGKSEGIDLEYDHAADNELATELLARNQIINHIHSTLNQFRAIANQTDRQQTEQDQSI